MKVYVVSHTHWDREWYLTRDKLSGAEYHGLCALEDRGDAGDEYTFSAPRQDAVLPFRWKETGSG